MGGSNEIQAERERIKAIINRKIDSWLDWRAKNRRTTGFNSLLEKLREQFIFLIDNPNYKPQHTS